MEWMVVDFGLEGWGGRGLESLLFEKKLLIDLELNSL